MKDKVFILDDGYKYVWNKSEIEEIKTLWKEEYLPSQIALAMKEDIKNVWLALNHLYFKGEISFDRYN